MKYENIKKHTGTLIVFVLFAVIVVGFKVNHDHKQRAEWESNRKVITVYVGDGDTLDEFGYKYKPEWMDVREYREEIKELNGMQTSTVYAGQELKVYQVEEDVQNAQNSIHD